MNNGNLLDASSVIRIETRQQKGGRDCLRASGGKAAACGLSAELRRNGYQYRCVIANQYGSVTSETVSLTVQ